MNKKKEQRNSGMADAVYSCWCYDGDPQHWLWTLQVYLQEGAKTGEGDEGSEVYKGVSALPANRIAARSPDSPNCWTVRLSNFFRKRKIIIIAIFLISISFFAVYCCDLACLKRCLKNIISIIVIIIG